jgi:hypothetical protein
VYRHVDPLVTELRTSGDRIADAYGVSGHEQYVVLMGSWMLPPLVVDRKVLDRFTLKGAP